jgi:hypothetical protein
MSAVSARIECIIAFDRPSFQLGLTFMILVENITDALYGYGIYFAVNIKRKAHRGFAA